MHSHGFNTLKDWYLLNIYNSGRIRRREKLKWRIEDQRFSNLKLIVLATKPRPAYTTVQTVFARLESKDAVRRVKKVGGAHIYEASVSREEAKRRLIDISYRLS